MNEKKPKKKMRPGGSGKKGKAYENSRCKDISLWITNGKEDDAIGRTQGSGSRFTANRKAGRSNFKSQAADVQALTPKGHWFCANFKLECKKYDFHSLQVAHILFDQSSLLIKFWNEHVALCDNLDLDPLMVVSENTRPDLLCAPLFFPDIIDLDLNWSLFPLHGMATVPLQQFFQCPYQKFVQKYSRLKQYIGVTDR